MMPFEFVSMHLYAEKLGKMRIKSQTFHSLSLHTFFSQVISGPPISRAPQLIGLSTGYLSDGDTDEE